MEHFLRRHHPEHIEGSCGGFYLYRNERLNPEDVTKRRGHRHWVDHVTYVQKGTLQFDIEQPGGNTEVWVISEGNFFLIKAGLRHAATPREPGTRWYCMFAEAEVMKWLEQKRIRAAIRKLEEVPGAIALEVIESLRCLLITCEEEPDWVETMEAPRGPHGPMPTKLDTYYSARIEHQ